jgi:aspartyl-tRNA synthetase
MEIRPLSEAFAGTGFKVVREILERGGEVRGFVCSGGAGFSRKQLEALENAAKEAGAKGLIHLKYVDSRLSGPVAKFLGEAETGRLAETVGLVEGDLLLAVAGEAFAAAAALGKLRLAIGRDRIPGRSEGFRFLWVNDFPLFEWDEIAQACTPAHHLFSMPREEDIPLLESDPLRVRARLYDLVCNGVELASGSIRVHVRDLQERIMAVAGIGREEAERRFGFLLGALEYGAPPHGGIAPGLDRIAMILAGGESIRDVIAFPKTQRAVSLMDNAPSPVDPDQLDELHIQLKTDR